MIEITSSGITLLQDSGRSGSQAVGVGKSGAWDDLNYQLVSKVLNEANPTVFEIIRGKLNLTTSDQISFVVVGDANCQVDGRNIGLNTLMLASPGSHLAIQTLSDGPVYLGITGLITSKVLGSSATDTLSGLGPSQVAAGDQFETLDPNLNRIGTFIQKTPKLDANVIRFVRGPHFQEIPSEIQVATVSRTGVRFLSDLKSTMKTIPSFPVFPGAIQLTPTGELIALGVDCGTTGGYPVVGVAIEADLPKLARVKPNQKISFREISSAMAGEISERLASEISQSVINPANFGSW
ncbi:MAG: hypothetical protein ACKOFA_06115 [Rhodoluna sp.]